MLEPPNLYVFNKPSQQPGAVSDFYSEGCELASEASRKFLAPPWHFLAPPCRGVPRKKPSTYKHRSDILLIYIIQCVFIDKVKSICSPFYRGLKYLKYNFFWNQIWDSKYNLRHKICVVCVGNF